MSVHKDVKIEYAGLTDVQRQVFRDQLTAQGNGHPIRKLRLRFYAWGLEREHQLRQIQAANAPAKRS